MSAFRSLWTCFPRAPWLVKAARYHDPSLGSIIAHRMFDKLHDDPRWLAFLSENGIAPEQLAAIKFDVKVPD